MTFLIWIRTLFLNILLRRLRTTLYDCPRSVQWPCMNNLSILDPHPFVVSRYTDAPMCYKVTCKCCAEATWMGCGLHVDDALRGIKEADLCPNWKKRCRYPCGVVPGIAQRSFRSVHALENQKAFQPFSLSSRSFWERHDKSRFRWPWKREILCQRGNNASIVSIVIAGWPNSFTSDKTGCFREKNMYWLCKQCASSIKKK